ncbi:phage major capsid protein, partial [Dickeya solani]|nr:phage major capsid protein [Dickeya solani]
TLDDQIGRVEELRRLDQVHVEEQEDEQRQQQRKNTPEEQSAERRAAAFDKFLRHGFGELSAEERQAIKELRAQGTSP